MSSEVLQAYHKVRKSLKGGNATPEPKRIKSEIKMSSEKKAIPEWEKDSETLTAWSELFHVEPTQIAEPEIVSCLMKEIMSRYGDYDHEFRRPWDREATLLFLQQQLHHWIMTEPIRFALYQQDVHEPLLYKHLNDLLDVLTTVKQLMPHAEALGKTLKHKKFDILSSLQWIDIKAPVAGDPLPEAEQKLPPKQVKASFKLELWICPTNKSLDDCRSAGDRDRFYELCEDQSTAVMNTLAAHLYPGESIQTRNTLKSSSGTKFGPLLNAYEIDILKYEGSNIMYSTPGTGRSYVYVLFYAPFTK